MIENREMLLSLLEKKIITLIRDIDIQREREHIGVVPASVSLGAN